MQTRRNFLGAISLPTFAATAAALEPRGISRALEAIASLGSSHASPGEAARDEDFWFEVSQAFTVDRSMLNLNNGGVSPSPRIVQEAMKRHLDFSNLAPAYTMWRILEPQRETVRAELAREWGVDKEEIAITRNASESLQICQNGFDFERGDEVLTTTQDYPRMLTTFRQRERRHGIVLKTFRIPIPCEDPAEIVRRFEAGITPRTKLILMCHVINLTGQVLPVRAVVAMARKRGIPVIVDGAHALAHLDFKIADLECDYYGVSLHKWLFAPHGTGLLYVRKDKIRALWPMQAADTPSDENIRKFEEIGTHPAANFLAIGEALSFHRGLGGARKQARMSYLRDYWMDRLKQNSRVKLHTSQKPGLATGVGNVEIDGLDSSKLGEWLWEKHRIFVTPIKLVAPGQSATQGEGATPRAEDVELEGLRISPSVYTLPSDLERFCDAMEQAMASGIGK